MDSILPWDRFADWIRGLVVVTFDLELGQTLEMVYPPHVKLTEEEKSNICYLSFPDSNSGCMGDTKFFFRIRSNSTPTNTLAGRLSKTCLLYNQKCPSALQIDQNYMLGYVYFRQVKDPSLRRGYFQKSLVILSRFPFVNLFHQVLEILAPEFFENGSEIIESACRDIYHWPAPVPGMTVKLPILGTVLQVLIPNVSCVRTNGSPTKCKVSNSSSFKSSPVIYINSIHDPDLFQCLRPVLSHIHLIWELILVAEPIVIMAPLPDICANTVHALISTIFPLKFCADYRPYFTIHDTDFKEYTMKSTPPPPVVIGTCNPFFAKTLQHWPHIIRMGDNSGMYTGKLKKASNIKLLDSQPGVYTSYKPYLQKDNNLLKKIVLGMQTQRPAEVQTAILRIHLQELTESFMIPLERYMGSLMPLQKNISPFKATPLPRPFNPDDFLATLEVSGPQLTSGIKGEWAGLYKKFFRSLNFAAWYEMRYTEARYTLQALHLEVISDTNVQEWISGKDEVQIVDWILKLREQISQTHVPLKECVREKLQKHVDTILKTLPEDLQTVLKPKR